MADVINFDNANNYQKETIVGVESMTASNASPTDSFTVNHNLGYRPNVQAWFETVSGNWSPASVGIDFYLASHGGSGELVDRDVYYQIYNNSVTFYLYKASGAPASVTTNVKYRIYVNEAA